MGRFQPAVNFGSARSASPSPKDVKRNKKLKAKKILVWGFLITKKGICENLKKTLFGPFSFYFELI